MDIGNETDIYIPRIKFTSDPKILSIQRLNRLQNKLDLLFADINTGNSKLILAETDSCWVEVYDDLYFLERGKQFIWSSDRDNFHHLYLYDYDGNLINRITGGDWEVIKLSSIDEQNEKIYYTSNETGVIYKDLFCINFNGSGKRKITSERGEYKVEFSPDNNCFIDYYSNPTQLKITSLKDSDGNLIRNLRDPDMTFFEEYGFSAPEFFSFETSDGVDLNAEIFKPKDFDESRRYPVLIYAYGGPGSQLIEYSWGGSHYLWHQLLNQKGYIIFMLDNRGTGGRGKKFKTMVYKNLGYWELYDMVEGVKYLSSLPFVDNERIGIWGWSYGAYLSALSILKAPDYFKTAIAIAPVTHWKFYDTIYSERYMQTPALNPKGYEESAPLNYVHRLKRNFLLIHGTGDDNVHFQNSVELMKKLIEEDKQFRMMPYPGWDHSISGDNADIHLYKLLTEFILENL
jgi:dipeptidyl-peptidase-4